MNQTGTPNKKDRISNMKVKWQSVWADARPSTVLYPIALADDGTWIGAEVVEREMGAQWEWVRRDFKVEVGETLWYYGPNGRIAVLGLSKTPGIPELLKAVRLFSLRNRSKVDPVLGVDLSAFPANSPLLLQLIEALSNGLLLGGYDNGKFKTEGVETHPFLQENAALEALLPAELAQKEAQIAFERGVHFAETQALVFDLINAPGNKKSPRDLGAFAERGGRDFGYKVEVFEQKRLEEEGFFALLGVNQGSQHPPVCTLIDYQPRGKAIRTIGLVGKGVTFDTGGISIKPSANLHWMKSDMGGGAAVLGAIELAARLSLPIRIIGMVPATENSVDSLSLKPGDIIGSYAGKTIEVTDTDAEGRLILADALAYVTKNYELDTVIDLATLTGSAARALGAHAAALFSNNDQLCAELTRAGEGSAERVWRMPLWDAYKDELKSDVADLRNFSGRPTAGAISAAKFLEVFTNAHPAWAHLDIAGVAFNESEFSPQRSANGFGLRLLVQYLEDLIAADA
jgi:leucyl aminopeptidase